MEKNIGMNSKASSIRIINVPEELGSNSQAVTVLKEIFAEKFPELSSFMRPAGNKLETQIKMHRNTSLSE